MNKVIFFGDFLIIVVLLFLVEFISMDFEINVFCFWVIVYVFLMVEVYCNIFLVRMEIGVVDVVGRFDLVVLMVIVSFVLFMLERILVILVYFMDVK